jgi:hypothetical protein
MFWLQMSGIIAVATLILLWWVYSAGREVDKHIFRDEDHVDYTIAKGPGMLYVWSRGLTGDEMLQLLESGCEVINEYNDWEALVEDNPEVSLYVAQTFKFKKK